MDGYIFTLSSGPICWRSTLQSLLVMSTTKVEYMAAGEAVKEALWLKGLVKELGVDMLTKPVPKDKFRYCLDLVNVCIL